MKQYMMIFRMKPDFNYQPTVADLAAQQQAWGKFIGNIAIQEKLVSTHQLGFEGTLIDNQKSTTTGIHLANEETLGGNMIVTASSLEEATEMAKECPILAIGGNVEVRSITPMNS
ncbi:Uncharacterized conserved protein [Spirosomataceae bacterium TFI 002]|nr:Uncharacterized conserved protein [Spirosomataceae bacterium TFI 002]